MKKKLLLFLVILSFGIIVTYPSFPISGNLISYCDVCNGYKHTAIVYLEEGRFFNYIFYSLFNIINLPNYSLGFVSALLSNIFLALSITMLYNFIIKNKNSDNKKYNLLVLVCMFLLYYNPLIISVFLLDEAFIICLGIMLLTSSVIKIYSSGVSNYILSLLLAILGIFCYQRIASYYFVILFITAIFIKEKSIKKIFLGLLNYIIAFTSNFAFVSLVSKTSIKFNIIKNANTIFTKLIPNSLRYYFGFMNNGLYVYYFICFISLILFFIILFKNESKNKNILLFIGMLISSTIIPFIPNLFMNNSTNYVDAVMCLTIDIIPVCIVLILINISINKVNMIFYVIILTVYACVSFYSIHQNLMIDIKRYQTDITYINEIKTNIEEYELENNKNIKTVYYIVGKNVSSYYPYGFSNGANINILNIPWAFECEFKNVTEKKYRIKKLKTNNYKKYITNYDSSIDDFQYEFNNDTAYVLIDR